MFDDTLFVKSTDDFSEIEIINSLAGPYKEKFCLINSFMDFRYQIDFSEREYCSAIHHKNKSSYLYGPYVYFVVSKPGRFIKNNKNQYLRIHSNECFYINFHELSGKALSKKPVQEILSQDESSSIKKNQETLNKYVEGLPTSSNLLLIKFKNLNDPVSVNESDIQTWRKIHLDDKTIYFKLFDNPSKEALCLKSIDEEIVIFAKSETNSCKLPRIDSRHGLNQGEKSSTRIDRENSQINIHKQEVKAGIMSDKASTEYSSENTFKPTTPNSQKDNKDHLLTEKFYQDQIAKLQFEANENFSKFQKAETKLRRIETKFKETETKLEETQTKLEETEIEYQTKIKNLAFRIKNLISNHANLEMARYLLSELEKNPALNLALDEN